MSATEILKAAKALPMEEQIELCRNLWKDIEESIELAPGEAELIDRRLREHLDNPDGVVFWGDVKARLDAKYRK